MFILDVAGEICVCVMYDELEKDYLSWLEDVSDRFLFWLLEMRERVMVRDWRFSWSSDEASYT